MSIATSDLVLYAAANQPTDDVSTGGGAIDAKRFLDFTQLAANDTVQVVSSSAADTQNITVVGRNAGGSLVTETKALTGVTPITLSTLGTVERLISADLASDAAGTVTVRRTTGPTTIRTIPAGARGFVAVFSHLASDASVQKIFYAKGFWKNTHGTLSLLSAAVTESADPDDRITFGLAASVDDSATIATRLTAPAGISFAGTSASVPGTDLAAGSAIGIWFALTLPAGDIAHKTTYTTQLAGNST